MFHVAADECVFDFIGVGTAIIIIDQQGVTAALGADLDQALVISAGVLVPRDDANRLDQAIWRNLATLSANLYDFPTNGDVIARSSAL